jgi:hypothetical protein
MGCRQLFDGGFFVLKLTKKASSNGDQSFANAPRLGWLAGLVVNEGAGLAGLVKNSLSGKKTSIFFLPSAMGD